jgi:hypothetical protein
MDSNSASNSAFYDTHIKFLGEIYRRIPFYIYLRSVRLHFVKKKVKIVVPYWSVQVTMSELGFTSVRPLELRCGICFTALFDMAPSRRDKMLALLYVISFFRIVCLC